MVLGGVQKSWREKEMTHDELACIYSALILADDDIPVTAEKINTILKAANVDVESIWPSLFARALQGVNIKELITGSLAGGAVGGAAGPGGATGAPAEEEKTEEVPPAPVEDEDDSDEDFGLSLFD